ncbi:hypothetical protein VDGE_02964 [Verticillium dahliae]|uniref:Extradiol ring-cleavage dioxygenase class III enzyme subunit B domain-containing protein n=1 Tax=Verticillium dahliae TaxID=27337 RepID=A0A444RRN0_VERDA|nr:hypothetical protein VDGE_02964 [Verticillium dahliae]
MTRGAVICISHGGGPMPVLGDPGHKDIVSSLTKRVPKLLRLNTPEAPRAIVVVTAHWSTRRPTISSATHHDLYYDYGGFPSEAYSLKYPAPGSPDVAEEVRRALAQQGLDPVLDAKRGWDHGVFIPFLLINPAADVPIVQLSVLASESEEEHRRMGLALASLRDSNVAIVGSGFASLHNMRKFGELRAGAGGSRLRSQVKEWNAVFFDMHPSGGGEHFMPLLVCSGAAGDEAAGKYKDDFLGADIWTYYWGEPRV